MLSPSHSSPSLKTAPYFILVAGPTGSGKTGLVNKVKKYLDIPQQTLFSNFLIDNYVEKSDKYIALITKIIKEYCGNKIPKNLEDCQKLKTAIETLNPEILNQFESAYFNTRDGRPPPNLNFEMNNNMYAAMKAKKNIIFEFVGGYWPVWLFFNNTWQGLKEVNRKAPLAGSAIFIENEYTVVLAFTIAEFQSLIKRNKSRTITDMNKFLTCMHPSEAYTADKRDVSGRRRALNVLSGPKCSGPRLPNVNFDTFDPKSSKYYNMLSNITNIMDQAVDPKKKNKACIESCATEAPDLKFHWNSNPAPPNVNCGLEFMKTDQMHKDCKDCVKICKNIRVLIFNNPDIDSTNPLWQAAIAGTTRTAMQPIYDSNSDPNGPQVIEQIKSIINLPPSPPPKLLVSSMKQQTLKPALGGNFARKTKHHKLRNKNSRKSKNKRSKKYKK